MANEKILTAEEETKLLQPIADHVGEIQKKIDELRKDGTAKVQDSKNRIALLKEDKNYTKEERDAEIEKTKAALQKAQEVEAKNKAEVDKLVAEAESYINEHYDKEYFQPVKAACDQMRAEAKAKYDATLAQYAKEHEENLKKIDQSHAEAKQEEKDENYVYKNKQFDAKMTYDKDMQVAKDRQHEAFAYKYHMIDLLRMSKFTFAENRAQGWENYKYTFNRKQFFLTNGLYIVIVCVFIMLGIITPIIKHTPLFTYNNILNILQQASPRMFLALGVAGLILLTGTDVSSAWAWLPVRSSCTRARTPVEYSDMFLISQAFRSAAESSLHCSSMSASAYCLHRWPASSQPASRCIRSSVPWQTCSLSSVSTPSLRRVYPLVLLRARFRP